MRIVPEKWTTIYDQWLENIQDWCISRQLWWGHQIPAWYDDARQRLRRRTREEAATRTGRGPPARPDR